MHLQSVRQRAPSPDMSRMRHYVVGLRFPAASLLVRPLGWSMTASPRIAPGSAPARIATEGTTQHSRRAPSRIAPSIDVASDRGQGTPDEHRQAPRKLFACPILHRTRCSCDVGAICLHCFRRSQLAALRNAAIELSWVSAKSGQTGKDASTRIGHAAVAGSSARGAAPSCPSLGRGGA